MLNPGTFLQNRYRIVQLIASGGMAIVYLAEDTRLPGHSCAVKEMSPAQLPPQDQNWAINAFRQEVQILAQLTHPGIVHVSDYFTEYGNWYLVMDFIEGHTLDAWLQQLPNGLPVQAALNYIHQICNALELLHAHTPPIIFRDLKPGNVMITTTGEVKLIDFGIARFFKPGQTHNTVNLGTPGYASPEHSGKGQTDPRSDIYSLGVLLHQLLTGHDPGVTPFNLPSASRLNSAVTPEIEAVIRRATQMSPDQRFQSMREFRAALLPPQPIEPAPTPRPAMPKSDRWKWAASIIGLIVIGLLILAVRQFNLQSAAAPAPALGPAAPAPVAIIHPTITPARSSSASQPTDTPTPPATSTPVRSSAPRIVFSRGDVGCSSLIVLDIDTGTVTPYRWQENTYEASWSPDGSKIVASSSQCQSGATQSLGILDLSTGQWSAILSGGVNIDADWGRDNRIYFTRDPQVNGNGELYSVRPDGSDLRQLGQSGRQPALSPDKTHVAFMRSDGRAWRIWVALLTPSGQLSGAWQVAFPSVPSGVHARMPNWTNDGLRLVYNVTDSSFNTVAFDTVDIATGTSHIWAEISAYGSHFARPACGANDLCVANEVTGGMWLLRESNGSFTVERQLTSDPKDWAADIFP